MSQELSNITKQCNKQGESSVTGTSKVPVFNVQQSNRVAAAAEQPKGRNAGDILR